MPKKGKGKGKKGSKGKKDKEPAEDDGLEGVSLEELKGQLHEYKDSNKKEMEERNYFQLERDKINTFWEITKKELEEKKAELRNKDREMEEMEERHQVEIKVYKQKVKHLLYEHQNSITQLKTDLEMATKLLQDEHRVRERELKEDKRSLKMELKELELSHEDFVRNLKESHDKQITLLRGEFEQHAKELQSKYDKKMKNLREELEGRRKLEIHEVEERKNYHINELMKKHEKAFGEIKNYYNDITHNNLDLIKSLKEEVAEMKKKEAANEKLMFEIAQENKRLSEPLTRALKEVELLRHELSNYDKDKLSLHNTKARLLVLEDQNKQISWEHEVLQQRFTVIQVPQPTVAAARARARCVCTRRSAKPCVGAPPGASLQLWGREWVVLRRLPPDYGRPAPVCGSPGRSAQERAPARSARRALSESESPTAAWAVPSTATLATRRQCASAAPSTAKKTRRSPGSAA